ncbi:MAG: hypothetical protein ACTSRW_02015 [Candidatus Helarchaeota archaeon]
MSEALNKLLKKTYELDENQAKVLSLILQNGNISVGELSILSGEDLNRLKTTVEELEKLKLIKKLPGKAQRYRALPPYQGFLLEIERLETFFKKIHDDIREFSSRLSDAMHENVEKQIDEIKKKLEYQKELLSDSGGFTDDQSRLAQSTFEEIDKNSIRLNNRLVSMFSEYLNVFESRMNKIKNTFTDQFTDRLNEIKKIKLSKKDALEEKALELIAPQKENIKNQFEILSSNLQNSLKLFQDESLELKNKLFQSLSNIASEIEDLSGNLEKSALDLLKEHNKTLDSIFSTIERQLIKFFPRVLEFYQKNSSELKSQQIGTIKSFLRSVDETLKKIREREQHLIKSLIKMIQDKSVGRIDSVKNLMQIQKMAVDEIKEDVENQFNEFLSQNLTIYSDLIKDLQEKLRGRINEFSAFSNTFMQDLDKKLTDMILQNQKLDEKNRTNMILTIDQNLKEHLESIQSEFNEYLTNTSTIFQEKIISMKSSFSGLKNQISDKLSENSEDFEKQVFELKDIIQKIIDSQIDNILREEESFEIQFRNRVIDELKRINSSIKEIKNDTVSYITESLEAFNTEMAVFRENFDKNLTDRIETLEQNYQKGNEATDLLIQEFSDSFQQFIDKMQKRIFDSSTKQHSLVKDLLGTVQKRLTSSITSHLTAINEKLTAFRDNFKTSMEKKMKTLREVQKFESKISEEFNRYLQMLKQSSFLIKDNLTNSLDKHATDFGMLSETLKSTFNEAIAKETINSEQFLNNIIVSINTVIGDRINTSKSKFDNVSNEISKIIRNSFKQVQTSNKALNAELSNNLTETLSTWQEKILEMQESFEKLSQFSEKLTSSTKRTRVDLEQSFSEKMELIIETFTEIEDDFKVQHAKLMKAFERTIDGIERGKDDVYSHMKNQLKDITRENEIRMNELTEKNILKIQEEQTGIKNTLIDDFRTSLQAFHQNFELRKDQLKKQIVEFKSSALNTGLDRTRNSIELVINGNSSLYGKKIAPIEKKMSNIMPQFLEEYDIFARNVQKLIFTAADDLFDKLEAISKSGIEILTAEFSTFLKDAKQDSVELSSEIKTQLLNHFDSLKNMVQLFEQELEMKSGRLLSNYSKTIDDLQYMIDSGLGKLRSTTSLGVDEVIRKIQDDFREVDVEVKDVKNILQETWNEVEKMSDTGMDKTWTITSANRVNAHIIEMIKRARSSITIIIPDLASFPDEVFQDIPEHVRVHIFSDFDLSKINILVNKLLTFPNIRIWQLTNYKLYYGALRDSEEMLIAPAALEPDEVVGFVSEQEGNIKLFRNVLGPSFYSDAKEVKINQDKNSSEVEFVLI